MSEPLTDLQLTVLIGVLLGGGLLSVGAALLAFTLPSRPGTRKRGDSGCWLSIIGVLVLALTVIAVLR